MIGGVIKPIPLMEEGVNAAPVNIPTNNPTIDPVYAPGVEAKKFAPKESKTREDTVQIVAAVVHPTIL